MGSPQQNASAENIRRAMLVHKIRYAILMARCQSGKTGAFLALAHLMLSAGEVMHVYILCGSSEIELRTQAKSRAAAALPVDTYTVLFRQDFKGAKMNITNALVIVDESHLDQNKGSELDIFLARHGLSMDGNPAGLDANNAYLLSVDATPYSELAALTHKETPYYKHVENLMPGPGYFGLGDYKGTGRLLPTFSIANYPSRFAALLADCAHKWVLVRLSSSGKKADAELGAIKTVCAAHGYRLKYFTADSKNTPQIEVAHLVHAPTVTTVVIVRGRLRAGKTVPKQHIGFVWEGAAKPKTDALVQGLPGRMCGYVNRPGENDSDKFLGDVRPLIFVAPDALKEYENKVVKASEMGRAVLEYPIAMPQKGANLKKSTMANIAHGANGRVRTQCPPLAICYDRDDAGYDALWTLTASSADFRVACHTLLRQKAVELRAQVAANNVYTPAQKEEILQYLMVLAEPNFRRAPQKKYYEALITAFNTKTTPAEHISDSPNCTFVVWHPEYHSIPGAVSTRVFVIFYTDSGPDLGLSSVHIESRIPRTNGNSVFTPHDHDFDEPPVAGGVVGFRAEAIRTPEGFERTLTEYLTRWRDAEALTFARLIESASGRFSLDKRVFHYRDGDDNDVRRICVRVGAAFGVGLKVKFAASSRGADGHFNVKSISW